MEQKHMHIALLSALSVMYLGSVGYILFSGDSVPTSANITQTNAQVDNPLFYFTEKELLQKQEDYVLEAQEKTQSGEIDEAKMIYTKILQIQAELDTR